MEKVNVVTHFKLRKIARDEAIFNDHESLMKEPFAMSTMIADHLMEKYNISSRSTIWQIVKQVRARKNPEFAKRVFEEMVTVTNQELASRDEAIFKEFNELAKQENVKTVNVYQALTAKYKMSRPAIYQAMKRVKLRTDPIFRDKEFNEISKYQND